MEFFNDRSRSAHREGDDDRALDKDSLREANSRLRSSAPDYRKDTVRRQIRNTAVRRHRARKSGQEAFRTVGEYLNFMTGAGNER